MTQRDYQVRFTSDRFPHGVVKAGSKGEAIGWYISTGQWECNVATGETQPPAQALTVQAAQDALDKLNQARRETMDCLHGPNRPAGLDGRYAGPLGLVRALVQRVNEVTAERDRPALPLADEVKRAMVQTIIQSYRHVSDDLATQMAETIVAALADPTTWNEHAFAAADDARRKAMR